ncbi:MAG: carboxypeptidase-like regulatory domain-containing protein, partial [Ekhidna sp.]
MRLVSYSLFFLSIFIVHSQTGIKGTTKSESGEVLPFSTVYIKGTTNGTTSNSEGQYFLKTPIGSHIIVAQHVGYRVAEKAITLNEAQTIRFDFALKEQALQLQEVVVTAGDEDPAYRVIREAI